MLTLKGCAETVFFREWFNEIFDTLKFTKKSRYDDHLFFINVQTLMWFPEMEQKNEKKILVFKIIAFEPNQQIVIWKL